MLDIRFVREHPDEVKENIKKKFQDAKLPLVDEVINLDAEYRAAIGEGDTLRANRNKLSKQIGMLMGQAKKDPSKAAEAEEIKKQVTAQADRLKELETKEAELQDKIRDIMYTIPQMIDPSVPIGPDDSCNVEVQRFGDPVVPDYPIPYHVDIMESFDGRQGGQAQAVPARLYGFLRFRLRLGENGAHVGHFFAEGECDGLAVVGELVGISAFALFQQIREQEH